MDTTYNEFKWLDAEEVKPKEKTNTAGESFFKKLIAAALLNEED